jgi:DNA-directed RNA polymerase subunit alpha
MEAFPLPTTFSEEKSAKTEGTFVLEPCYPGYGVTIGNALRRVLLSSLPGVAITSVKIDGVDHEFTGLEGVKEDVVNILLNLKMLRFALEGAEEATVSLSAKGKKTVTGKDFEKNAQVEVLTPDQQIATLTDDAATFNLEATIERGRGYVPVESQEEQREIGRVAVDAIFTPVRNVNYTVEHVRVGKMTNFDRLTMHITTDGSLTPREALDRSAGVLVDHFSLLTLEGVKKAKKAKVEEKPKKTSKTEEKKEEAKKD